MYYKNFKKNKFGAKKQTYNGNRYDSEREAQKAQELDLLLRAKEIKGWKRQVKIEINFKKNKKGEWILTDEPAMKLKEKGIEFRHFRNYFMDFVIEHFDSSQEYLEIKGFETEVWKQKFFLTELMFENHPNIFLTVEK
jgi:hypothetical protein